MKRLIIIIASCFIFCGCEVASERNDFENIETCKSNGGIVKVEYFGDRNEIKRVTCLYENEKVEDK